MARHEVPALLEILRLPISDRGRRRAAARAEWFAARDQPLDTGDTRRKSSLRCWTRPAELRSFRSRPPGWSHSASRNKGGRSMGDPHWLMIPESVLVAVGCV